MVIDIKMCRFDNVPWGFRLVGGSDFECPLTVVKVTEGSIAEEAGLRVDDIIVRINDTAATPLTHDEANKIIKSCGNVFYFGVYRENIETPKQFPIIGVERPSTPESFMDASSSCKSPVSLTHSDDYRQEEYLPELPERPCSVLSENTEIKLVEEEIAAVLSGETEVLKDHNVLGVNFYRIFPKPGVCMSSDVLRTLNEEATKTKAEKDKENKKWTTFLQKPNRPIPKSKQQIEAERRAANAYKVKICKSAPRTPERERSPAVPLKKEPEPEPEPAPQQTPVEPVIEEPPPADSEVPNLEETTTTDSNKISEDSSSAEEEEKADTEKEVSPETEKRTAATTETEPTSDSESTKIDSNICASPSQKTEEELALERQLSNVQQQLAALSSLPSTIQATLDAVTKQLAELLPTFKLQQLQPPNKSEPEAEAVTEARDICLEKIEEQREIQDSAASDEGMEEMLEMAIKNHRMELQIGEDDNNSDSIVQTYDANDMELGTYNPAGNQHKGNMKDSQDVDDEQHLKKQKRHDVIEELEEHLERKNNPKRRSKRAFGPLTPSSERPLVLPGGRRWYRPKDAYNDEFIAETLSAQAELITGTTLGSTFESPLLGYDSSEYHSACVAKQLEKKRVNFMKYQKPEKKIDLNRSEVYKVIHHLDRQPVRGIEVRAPVVPAEVDIRKAVHS